MKVRNFQLQYICSNMPELKVLICICFIQEIEEQLMRILLTVEQFALQVVICLKGMFQIRFAKLLGSKCLRSQLGTPAIAKELQKRELSFLLEWFIKVFNGVDKERLNLVGPNCACAEWLLRNGASVRFKGHPSLLSDYNELLKLEETGVNKLKVEEIFAEDTALHAIGFDHLQGCNDVKKITFIFCSRLHDLALEKLSYVKNSLEFLEMRSCFNITDEGLKSLHNLRNLKTLILADLHSVNNKNVCETTLRKALPQCKIDFQM